MSVEPESSGDVAQSPLVSVIVPCYNSARTLGEAIDSALRQTWPNVEVIVVNDGSTDDSSKICESYGGRIRLVSQQNRGLGAARNAGAYAASGEYLTLLDADDILLPECLENRMAILMAEPSIGLVAGWFREIDFDGNAIDRIPELRQVWNEQPFRQAVRRNWGPPVGWTFSKEVFLRVGGFDPFFRSCEDWDFVIRVARKYRIGYDDTPQVVYRKSAGQMSSHHHVMLDASERVHRKNRAYADDRISYWLDVQFGRFELGRRTLYSVLLEQKRGRARALLELTLRHPYLIWVLCLSVLSYLNGKRASSSTLSPNRAH